MSESVKLNERTRASLLGLFNAMKAAESRYNIAVNHALAALGFDPADANQVDLDTGVIVPPEQTPEPPAEPPKE